MKNVLKKLQALRIKLQHTELKKSGQNKFAGYKYFELGDFLPIVQDMCMELEMCGVVSYTEELATLTVTDYKSEESVQITSPMGSAALKGCHSVQNIGACQTYMRRYLWITALEIVEHDALDATTGNDSPPKQSNLDKDLDAHAEKASKKAASKSNVKQIQDAFAGEDISLDELENALGKPVAKWIEGDVVTLRQMFVRLQQGEDKGVVLG